MGEKKIRIVSNRTVAFFVGVFICLLGVVLIMNVGYPARGVAFPFFYLFGIISYLLYLLLYILGCSFIFRGKGIKFKFNLRFIGAILLLVAVISLTTLIQCKDDGLNKDFFNQYQYLLFGRSEVEGVQTFTDSTGGYWKATFINMFGDYHFGGGLLGYAIIGSLLEYTSTALTYTIVILAIVLSLIFIFFHEIIWGVKKLIAFIKNKKASPKKEKPVKEKHVRANEYEFSSENEYTSLDRRPISSFSEKQMIKSASSLDDSFKSAEPTRPILTRPNNINNNYQNPQPTRSDNYATGSSFFPARFVMNGTSEVKETMMVNPIPTLEEATPMFKKQEEQIRPEQVLLDSQKEVTKNEQLTLDFNAKPELNEELVTAKPEFKDPEPVINPTPSPAPMVIEPAVIKTPIKKKLKWIPPSVQLLEDMQVDEAIDKNNAVAEQRMEAINSIFQDFGVGAQCVEYVVGPSVTNFKIKYENNVTVRSVNNLVQDISVRLGGVAARFEGVVEGSRYSGIEVSNAVVTSVSFKEIYENLPDVKKKPLAVGFGKNIEGKIVSADFAEFPHVLVAGTTGSGKSVYIHSVICTLIMRNSPDDLKLVLIDPKQVEMASYRDIPHLLCPVITETKKAKGIMDKLVQEMNDRYQAFQDNIVRSITEYNELMVEQGKDKMPYIVVVIDEYADLVQTCKEISGPVVAIAQKARAAGIHMLISTQRPSTDVITGVIKGNLPTRVALSVSSQVDSVTVLGEGGAEKLLGRGDMLVSSPLISRVGPVRLQGCYIKPKEMRYIIGYLKEHYTVEYDPRFLNLEEEATKDGEDLVNSPAFNYDSEDNEEAKYKSVKEWVMSNKYMSMSRIQRECSVGFNRAGRFFKRLQNEGVIGTEPEGAKGCPVLTHDDFYDNDNVVTSDELTSR